MTIKTLANHPYAQARVEILDDGTINLISYRTLVCQIDKDGYLECTGTYSRTTISHIGWFVKEYTPALNYYDAKAAYEHGYRVNIHEKGDTIPLTTPRRSAWWW